MTRKYFFLVLGFLCCLLGFMGLILPILPTTPFLILAVYCFSKSSQRLHHYLMQHPRVGRPLSHWFRYGVIQPLAKKVSIFFLTCSYLFIVVSTPLPLELKITLLLVFSAISYFIYSRPGQVPRSVLILGGGRVGMHLVQLLKQEDQAVAKASNIFITTHSPKKSQQKNGEKYIYFDLQHPPSWEFLPLVDFTFWTFPLGKEGEKEALALEKFWQQKHHLLGKVVGIGSTSHYLPQLQGDWIDEKQPLANHPRWQQEKFLVQQGCVWALMAGIYDETWHPSGWISSPQVLPHKWVNLISLTDCCRSLIHLALYAPAGEIYNVCEDAPYLWRDLASYFYQRGDIGQEVWEKFLLKTPLSLVEPEIKVGKEGKKISNQKIIKQLKFKLRYNVLNYFQ